MTALFMNIDIPSEYVPKMLKGKGQIEPRIPYGPFVVATYGKESPGKDSRCSYRR